VQSDLSLKLLFGTSLINVDSHIGMYVYEAALCLKTLPQGIPFKVIPMYAVKAKPAVSSTCTYKAIA
jgi:hypothetical protein